MPRRSAAADDAMMDRAVALARRGLGATYPNPSVGAVVAKAGRIVGEGRTAPTGGPHAEVRALQQAARAARGSTLYVTLEPCSHHGRTPPCTDAIVAAGVRRVVFGVIDSAPHASGRGIERLRSAGIEVEVGVRESKCHALHEHYLHHTQTRRPFVTLKTAASLDGRLSVRTGDSKWITSEPSRRFGHRMRAQHHAIAVGMGTVLADDPKLSVRLVPGCDPLRVVFDSRLRLAQHRDRSICGPGTWVLHTRRASARAVTRLQDCGVKPILVQSTKDGRVSVRAAVRALGRADVRSLMVEGGGALIGSFLQAQVWQRWYWFTAPRVLGDGAHAVEGVSWAQVSKTPSLEVEARRVVGADALSVLRPRRDGA